MIYKDGIEDKQEQTSTSATKYHVSLIVQRELEIIQSADHQKQSMIHKWWLPSWIVQGIHDVPVSACQIQIKQSDFTCTTFMWAVAKRVISWIVKSEFRRFYKDLLWVYKTSPVRCSKSLPHPERGGLKIQEWSLPGLSQIPFCVDTCLLTYSLTHFLLLTCLLTCLLACLLTYLFTYLHIYIYIYTDAPEMYLGILLQLYQTNQVLQQVPTTPVQQLRSMYGRVNTTSELDRTRAPKKTNTVCGDRGDIGILGSVGMQNVLSFSSDKWYCIWQML